MNHQLKTKSGTMAGKRQLLPYHLGRHWCAWRYARLGLCRTSGTSGTFASVHMSELPSYKIVAHFCHARCVAHVSSYAAGTLVWTLSLTQTCYTSLSGL